MTPPPIISQLKIYAIMALHNSIDPKILEPDKAILSIIGTYDLDTALMGLRRVIADQGKNPSEYRIPYFHLSCLASVACGEPPVQAVELPADPMKEKVSGYIAEVKESIVALEKAEEKSKEQIAAYVRMVFAEHGTATQRKVGEAVLQKFLGAQVVERK